MTPKSPGTGRSIRLCSLSWLNSFRSCSRGMRSRPKVWRKMKYLKNLWTLRRGRGKKKEFINKAKIAFFFFFFFYLSAGFSQKLLNRFVGTWLQGRSMARRTIPCILATNLDPEELRCIARILCLLSFFGVLNEIPQCGRREWKRGRC